ncbi:MAG: DUF4336 domain-containing protein [Cyanobacteriota bacterium]|nr:DUF4336 domain-containing protein [Cyanobacteriota bacterium]
MNPQKQYSIRPRERWCPWWPLIPLYPYDRRRTLRQEVLKDTLWTFDQLQGIFYVIVPIRMSAVRLETGGLLIYAPVAPTRECVNLVRELEARYGEVKYIILPTISGLEHKVFVGPFARRFPNAQVFVAPHQWSYPVDLPLSWLGFPPKRTHILPDEPQKAPFASEFDYARLGPIDLGLKPFAEVALYHKRSRSLLLTDTIVSIPEKPPAILQFDPYPLLFHAKEDAFDVVKDSEATRRKGWKRISLFAMYFRPSPLETIPFRHALRHALRARDRSKKAYFGLFPFHWQPNWMESFEALRDGGRPLVAPVLQTLILNRAPTETLAWVQRVAGWDFERIVPCHFSSPIAARSPQFRDAFAFLDSGKPRDNAPDFQLLKEIDKTLVRTKIVPPPSQFTMNNE